ncbi:Ig-like domain-containing protein [Saccharicrinis sp. GN24d3]|uniref:Ig-like domain-containing protein n=1 Tax=Saccharicrinis sp. GN24d3 TaxID=3458416 RepID=UPI0040354CF6
MKTKSLLGKSAMLKLLFLPSSFASISRVKTNVITRVFIIAICLFSAIKLDAQDLNPNLGLRANWLRGTWGLNWKPVDLQNGVHEGISIQPFLDQISHINTIDYIQVHLGESSIKSPVHFGPHPLLESFWQGDTDISGEIINLVVPRASYGEDPFLEIIQAVHENGMKVMVYVNSSNMLNRDGDVNPESIPNITERWKAWCDTDAEAQAFIASQPYHTGVWDADTETYVDATDVYPNRKYMFCYAEFVLKVYAMRYGKLIDAWCFDSGSYMVLSGDNATNGVYEDQMIYLAFAEAVRAGNPDAACSFQNSPNRVTEELNPFSEATHADDYMFGHPYNGGKNGGSHEGDPSNYDRNYAHIEKMIETDGYAHRGSDAHDWTWDDNVIAHYDPPMSTTSWNGGYTMAFTDDEFNLWNLQAMQNNGAISWGLPLLGKSSGISEKLVANDVALAQLNQMDAHLKEFEFPGAPNWSRAETYLPVVNIGEDFSRDLVDGVDFWDSEGDEILNVTIVNDGNAPSWLSVDKSTTETGTWTLSGSPTETENTEYEFTLQVEDAQGASDRVVDLSVIDAGNIAVTEILLSPNSASLYLGDTKQLSVIIYPSDASDKDYVWATSNESIATVTDGLVTAEGEGTVTISATTNDGGFVGECVISITERIDVTGMEISSTSESFDWPGKTLTLTANVLPVDASNQNFTWSSDAPDVATVDIYGVVSSLSEGTAIITAESEDGQFTATCEITVVIDYEVGYFVPVEIFATNNTDYGVSTVAVMTSETVIAPDGIATFQMSIDVTPETGKGINTGASGGIAEKNAWGLGGDDRDENKVDIFYGELGDVVEVNNIQIVNFEANGGDMIIEDFGDIVFGSITLINGQSAGKDAVAYTINNTPTDLGNLASNPFVLNLQDAYEFSIGVGTSADQTKNKWSVASVTVKYSVGVSTSIDSDNKTLNPLAFNIYPNPSKGTIFVTLEEEQHTIYQVYSLSGEKLLQGTAYGSLELDMSMFSQGIYLIKIESDKAVNTKMITLN